MAKTVLMSHALYETGMAVLKENAEVIVANNSDMQAVLDDLKKSGWPYPPCWKNHT